MCWKCKKTIDTSVTVYRTAVCPFCGTDLHACFNCRHYSPGAHYDCHETIDELVKDKERSNFCEWYSPRAVFTSDKPEGYKNSDAKKAFNSLFGD